MPAAATTPTTATTTPPTTPPTTPHGPAPAARSSRPWVRTASAAAGVAALVGLAALVPLAGDDQEPGPGPAAGAAAVLDPATLVPEVGPADITAEVPPRLDPVPAPGAATLLPGPMSRTVAVEGLALEAGERPAAVGTVRVVQDISTVIILELDAGFYDAQGALLGVERLVLRQPDFTRAWEAGTIEAQYGAALPFRIEAPDGLGPQVSSVAVAVPVLVNE